MKHLTKEQLSNNLFTNNNFNKLLHSNIQKSDLIYLSSNTTLKQTQINSLFDLQIDNININLLKNSNCPNNKIKEFLSLNDKIYNITIAHNENLDYEIFEELINLDDIDVDISLVFNKSTPDIFLEHLKLKNHPFIKEALSTTKQI